MALTSNPNKNKTLERKWISEINKRWAKARKAIKAIPLNNIVVNLTDPQQEEANRYMEEFTAVVVMFLLANNEGQWQNRYQFESYKRSIEKTNSGLVSMIPPEDQSKLIFLLTVAGAMVVPRHKNELNFLLGRSRDKLTGWVNNLISETGGILHDHIGKVSKDDLVDLIMKRLDVSKSRAKNIATTEITQAAQRAAITQTAEINAISDLSLKLRWITVADSRVRHLHAGWHGQTMTEEEASINITISPYGCRCGLKPVLKSKESQKIKEIFAKERKFLLAQQAQ